MSAPRHLWSGDWQHESSAHADDLAARRGRGEAPADPEPPAPRPRRRLLRRAIQAVRRRLGRLRAPSRRQARAAAVVALLALLVAGGAYAVTSGSNATSATNTPAPAALTANSEPWLGVELVNASVNGAVVARVIPGSPAAAAGIRPGDVITQLDTEPIVTPAIFVSAISGLRPGDTVDIQVQRGSSQFTANVRLASRPAGTP